jgi:hypothetical protein
MLDFRCIPIPAEVGERWARTGVDDGGNRLRRIVDEARPAEPDGRRLNGTGSPCRHCLRDAKTGQELLLGSYQMPRPKGIYWTPSPILVHAAPCECFARINDVAPIVRNRLYRCARTIATTSASMTLATPATATRSTTR